MKKMISLLLVAVIATVGLCACSKKTADLTVMHGDSGYGSGSIFGMWLPGAELDPYESMSYYLYDNLSPEKADGILPFELHTQKYTYVIDAYEPDEQELGVAWLKITNATTGKTVAFKYSPASYARICYDARSGAINLVDVEKLIVLES